MFGGLNLGMLSASTRGLLHATRTDDTGFEVLPRGMHKGQALAEVEAVLGVLGGFVVAGVVAGEWVAVHYDLGPKQVRAYALGASHRRERRPTWRYVRDLHLVAAADELQTWGVNLGARRVEKLERLAWPPQSPYRYDEQLCSLCPTVISTPSHAASASRRA